APLHRVLQLAHRGPPARFRRGGPFFTLPPKRAADHGHGGGVLRSHGLSEGDAGASATQPGKDASRLSLALPQWGGRSGQKSPLPNTLYLLRVGQFLSVGVDQFPSVANKRISRRHCREASNRLEYYWKPYFGKEKPLSEIRKSDINTFSLWLKQDKGLMANTVNNVLSAGTVAFRWAARSDVISKNPAEGLMGFSGKHVKRGVLTDLEVEQLFALAWPDKHSKVANMLAMSTGLRAGEILALQVRDIGDNRLSIRHSWNKWDALKGTKTGAERTLPIISSIRTSLL